MRSLPVVLAFLGLVAFYRPAPAGLDVAPSPPDLSAYATRAEVQAGRYQSSDQVAASIAAAVPYVGTFTIATLPPAAANQAKYAFVTDLGGGADMVLSDGTFWKRIRRGSVQNLTAASMTVRALSSPTILRFTSSTISSTVNVAIDTTGLYPGYELTVVNTGVIGVGGSLGVTFPGLALVPILGQRWVDFQYDGTALQVVRSGSL